MKKEVVFVAITSTKTYGLQKLVNLSFVKGSHWILVIGMQWLFWKMMLLSVIYQDSCNRFCHCLYWEMVPLIALLLVEEDIPQMCHREDLKILANYFSVASARTSINSNIFFPVKLYYTKTPLVWKKRGQVWSTSYFYFLHVTKRCDIR